MTWKGQFNFAVYQTFMNTFYEKAFYISDFHKIYIYAPINILYNIHIIKAYGMKVSAIL